MGNNNPSQFGSQNDIRGSGRAIIPEVFLVIE
jgi:hypothetical protein